MAEASFTFGIAGSNSPPRTTDPDIPEWERWNDYGIGLLSAGPRTLRQAAEAFRRVEQLGQVDGALNLVRTGLAGGGVQQTELAGAALQRAEEFDSPAAPPWTLLWLAGEIHRQQGRLADAETCFRAVLSMDTQETQRRGFDFSRDYVVNNQLGRTIFDRALQLSPATAADQRFKFLRDAVEIFNRTLLLDSENLDAHHNLTQLHKLLGQHQRSEHHQQQHARYHPDDTARGQAVAAGRQRYPAANAAAEDVVIYELRQIP